MRFARPVTWTPAPLAASTPFSSQVLPSTRLRLSTSIPSPVFAEAVQPVTALPLDAIIPSPVLPLAWQLLIVLDAPTEIPTTPLPSAVELVINARAQGCNPTARIGVSVTIDHGQIVHSTCCDAGSCVAEREAGFNRAGSAKAKSVTAV